MNIFNTDERNRGQVGIGTLIVFIAMVLVAAIAAGVLINTAGFLQTQAEDTGTESTEQVANNLNVITEVGDIGDDEDNIENIRLGVQPAAGSDDINLADLTLQYVSDNEFANIVVGIEEEDPDSDGDLDRDGADDAATGDTHPNNIYISNDNEVAEFGINVITAENEDDVVMTDNADRYEIEIPLEATDNNADEFDSIVHDGAESETFTDLEPLNEGNEVEITMTTEVGAQTIAFLQVPDSLSAQDDGDTVTL